MQRFNRLLDLKIRDHGLLGYHRIVVGASVGKPRFIQDLSATRPLPRLHGEPSVDFHGQRMGVAR